MAWPLLSLYQYFQTEISQNGSARRYYNTGSWLNVTSHLSQKQNIYHETWINLES